jgi:hypothetical protein
MNNKVFFLRQKENIRDKNMEQVKKNANTFLHEVEMCGS